VPHGVPTIWCLFASPTPLSPSYSIIFLHPTAIDFIFPSRILVVLCSPSALALVLVLLSLRPRALSLTAPRPRIALVLEHCHFSSRLAFVIAQASPRITQVLYCLAPHTYPLDLGHLEPPRTPTFSLRA
jgi:hypothetical protein